MNKEKALKVWLPVIADGVKDLPECKEALEMAIKALEQEPCEDAISRQAVLAIAEDSCLDLDSYEDTKEFCNEIKELPLVTPQPKTGHWIMRHRTYNEVKYYTGRDEMGETHTISVLERYEVDVPYCSECGKRAGDTSQDFCCVCGAKMESEE